MVMYSLLSNNLNLCHLMWLLISPIPKSKPAIERMNTYQKWEKYGTDLMQRRTFACVRVPQHASSSVTTLECECYHTRVRVLS